MAVDLGDLVESLQREISPPGTNLYPDATEDEYVGRLADAFWEARLHGLFSGYTEADGSVTPDSGTTEFPRDYQQLVVLYAGYRVVLSSYQNLNSVFRAQAGPVEYETQKSAQVLRGVLDALRERIKIALGRLSDIGDSSVAIFDAVIERDYALATGTSWWVG
jgi:hypothetical protein